MRVTGRAPDRLLPPLPGMGGRDVRDGPLRRHCGKFYEDLVAVIFRSDRKNSITGFRESSDAVSNQVQKDLHKAWPVSPHERQAGLYSPLCLDIFLLQ